jgi:hypothetical protein
MLQNHNDRSREYREEARFAIKESFWTLRRIVPLFLGVLSVLVLVGWGLRSTNIVDKDIDREVVQYSQQYTESKQAKLQNLYTQYTNLQIRVAEAEANGQNSIVAAVHAQQKAILAQMKRETTNIPSSEVPEEVERLIK